MGGSQGKKYREGGPPVKTPQEVGFQSHSQKSQKIRRGMCDKTVNSAIAVTHGASPPYNVASDPDPLPSAFIQCLVSTKTCGKHHLCSLGAYNPGREIKFIFQKFIICTIWIWILAQKGKGDVVQWVKFEWHLWIGWQCCISVNIPIGRLAQRLQNSILLFEEIHSKIFRGEIATCLQLALRLIRKGIIIIEEKGRKCQKLTTVESDLRR